MSEDAPSVVAVTDTVALIRRYVEQLEARDVVRGRGAYVRWNREYPDVWHLQLLSAYGDESGGAARLRVAVDREGEDGDALVFVTVADGRLAEISDWWPTPYEPDPARAHLADRE